MTLTINNKPLKFFTFNGGECQIIITEVIGSRTDIVAHLASSDDIMSLLLAVNAIRKISAETKINLTIPYFPYARQDRVCSKGEAFSLEVMAGLINGLHCERVTVYDPHSEVTSELLNNVVVVAQSDIILGTEIETLVRKQELILLAPDAGAKQKADDIAQKLGAKINYATKKRNQETGTILQTIIPDDVRYKKFILVDDICDGGRTFIELGKLLKENGASDLYLYVTHGIFSKGFDELKTYFNHIYCYHTLGEGRTIDNKFVTKIGELK